MNRSGHEVIRCGMLPFIKPQDDFHCFMALICPKIVEFMEIVRDLDLRLWIPKRVLWRQKYQSVVSVRLLDSGNVTLYAESE